jgi:hypothetical protein
MINTEHGAIAMTLATGFGLAALAAAVLKNGTIAELFAVFSLFSGIVILLEMSDNQEEAVPGET